MSPPESPAPDPGRAASARVIYVMGAGRSGSTILGVALGNCEGVFYAGELDKWLMRSGAPALGGAERAQFWERVRRRVDAAELFGFEARVLERSSALLSPAKWPVRRRLRDRYRAVSEQLYRAISDLAGATHVVDSSHYPLRARELQRAAAIELYLIFLVRDPRSVVASFARSDVPERSFGTLTTNAYLWLTHVISLAVYLRHPRRRRAFVRHEQFVTDPSATVRALLERYGSSAAAPAFDALDTGMPIQGNRLLRSPVVALEDSRAVAAPRSALTTLLQAPWQVVFRALSACDRLGSAPEKRPRRLR